MKKWVPLLLFLLALTVQGQERVYVRTDCARYAPGDRIWFRCYLFEGADREPSGGSLYVYAELADTLGWVRNRVKVIQRDGIFEGYMDIPAETRSGILLLRAYTMNMVPHPESFFVKAIPVGRAIFRGAAPRGNYGPVPRRCRVPASIAKESLANRDSVVIRFGLPDLEEDELLDLSLSVSADRESPSSILSYFRVFPSVPEWEAHHEQSQEISGTVVRSLSGKPVSAAKVSLVSPEANIMAVREAGKDGRFRFEGLDYPAGTQYVLKSTDLEGQGRYALKLDETDYPSLQYESGQIAWMDPFSTTPEEWDESLLAGSDRLLESSIVRARQGESYDVFASNSDITFSRKRLDEMGITSIHELLRRVPGVFFAEDQYFIRAQTSIMEERRPAAVALDGLIWDGFDINEIDMADVERVDVFKTGQTVLWGAAGGNGVISITTRSGAYSRPDAARPDPNIRKVMPLGYQREAVFSLTNPRNRSAFWAPQVHSEEIGFPVPPSSRPLRIVLEGVTSRGRLVHEEWFL